VPAVATLHNYLPVCPRGTLYRDGRTCTDCTQKVPLPAVRHGCYRNSRLATVPLAATTLVHRSLWAGVTRFFCISEAQRQTLVHAGMPPDRLTVKTNFVVDPGVRRQGLGRHVLYLGRMADEKGITLLLTAWDSIAVSGGLGMPLVLAGAGPLEEDVKRWAANRSDVSYLGLRNADECAQLIAHAAAVLAPSTWLETFGLVVVEAMAAGVPAVAAAHGAFVDHIEDGVSGVLHQPNEVVSLESSLRRVVLDADYNRALGLAARRTYEARFTPEAGLAALVNAYHAAIETAVSREPV
jgi:glycosyltransferase involved in cell wall biosynthesis